MKRFFALFALCLVFAGTQAQAETQFTSCKNGDIDKVGDHYFQLDILEDGMQFQQYETSFILDVEDVTYDGGTYSILNKKVTAFAEGDEIELVINAMITSSENDSKLHVALSYENGPFQTYELTCSK